MPAGYLLTVFLLGLSTYCALWPPGTSGAGRGDPGRRSRLATAAYLIGMTFNEAPAMPLLLGAAATALAVFEGDAATPAGAAGVGGMAVVAAGLLLIGWRAVSSRSVPARALDEALGRDRRRSHSGPAPARPGRWSVPAGLLLPFRRRRRGVRHIRNLYYGPAGRRNLLDLYLPRTVPPGGPVFVHLHGGRFVSGAKDREALYLLYLMASRGWSCVSANYRLAPEAQFPDYVVDTKRVIAWLRSTGAERGAGTGPLILAGSSAGGFLAAFAALTPNVPEYQPGFEDADTAVAGAVCLYGYYGRAAGDNPNSSPAAFAGPGAPPFFILHGVNDSVIPVEHGRKFARALRGMSRRPVAWCPLTGAQHSFDYFASVRSRAAAGAVADFADWVLSQGPGSAAPGRT